MSVAKLIKTIIKTGLKFILLVPILFSLVIFNYNIDCSGIFHTVEDETKLAEAIIKGENLFGYDNMNERKVYEEVARLLETPYETLAFGSSRILQLRQEHVGTTFLNCGLSNADYRDMMSTFYLFDRAGKLPKNIIIELNPNMFCANPALLNENANNKLYEEFLTTRLNIPTSYVPKTEPKNAKLKALFSPSYFQGNMKYYLSGKEKIINEATIVTQDLENQPVNVKLGDGGVLYNSEFRALSGEKLLKMVHSDALWFQRLDGFSKPDLDLVNLFGTFIEYIQSKGINVVFIAPPFHPTSFYYVTENKERMPAVFETEILTRQFAASHNIPFYGSCNPFVGAGFTDKDFFDGLHIKPEGIPRFFPGIAAANAEIAAGVAANTALYGGEIVSPKIAEYFITQRYEVNAPQVLTRLDDGLVLDIDSYIFARYDEAEAELITARFAVTKDAGLVYRLDTSFEPEKWVVDNRFSPD